MHQYSFFRTHCSGQALFDIDSAEWLPYGGAAALLLPLGTTPPLADSYAALLQAGGSTAAIMLALAVLIKALAELFKAVVPVMLEQRNKK